MFIEFHHWPIKRKVINFRFKQLLSNTVQAHFEIAFKVRSCSSYWSEMVSDRTVYVLLILNSLYKCLVQKQWSDAAKSSMSKTNINIERVGLVYWGASSSFNQFGDHHICKWTVYEQYKNMIVNIGIRQVKPTHPVWVVQRACNLGTFAS